MNESILRPIAAKALAAAVFLAGAWLLTVKPASATLDDRTRLLEAQSRAIEDHAARTTESDTTAIALDNLTARAEQFADQLTKYPTDTALLQAIESAASAHGVRVHRTEPRNGARHRQPPRSAKADGAGITAGEFTVELSGAYGSVVAFLDTACHTLGLVRVVDIRLAASTEGQVRGVVGLAVYRAPADAEIMPNPKEAGDHGA